VPAPEPPKPTKPDPALVAQAEAALDAASRDRARADDREAQARQALEAAQIDAATITKTLRSFARATPNPTASIASYVAKGELLVSQVKALQAEAASLAANPKPRRKPLIDRSPVARIVDGQELHFELMHGRVTFIDLDRLVEKVKADAQLQLRMSGSSGLYRPIRSTVGPVGAFSLKYELGTTGATSLSGMRRGGVEVSFGLRGWELIPTRETRGETWETALQPVSDFRRALNTVEPSSTTITLWVYPDSFALYHEIRDALYASGFTVAGRPLPASMPIRGSPEGSMSAAQ
jgi:hypothetical protein